MINCQSDAKTITVGEKKTLSCDLSGQSLTPQTHFEFVYNGKYEIQFLGAPSLQGTNLLQLFTSYKVGTQTINQIKLKIDGRENDVSPQSFEVKSIFQGSGQPTPYPLVSPETVPVPWWWSALWGAILAMALGFGIWQYIKLRKKRALIQAQVKVVKLTPQEKFQGAMRKLESKGLHQRGEYKLFALELTNIIKKTIGEELSFPAEDLTSEELLATLQRRHGAYFKTAGNTLEHFLADLDRIKFAKVETNSQQCSDLLDRGMRIGNALFGRLG